MYVYSPFSLKTTSRWLDSLAYIESITSAYSQHFANVIENTKNNEQCQVVALEQFIVNFSIPFPYLFPIK